jgi:UDPglucose--hexose-1-phosphate uridylyltransferase
MPELRHNVLTREWVIIATERAKRPEEFVSKRADKDPLPSYLATCPFCPRQRADDPAGNLRRS